MNFSFHAGAQHVESPVNIGLVRRNRLRYRGNSGDVKDGISPGNHRSDGSVVTNADLVENNLRFQLFEVLPAAGG